MKHTAIGLSATLLLAACGGGATSTSGTYTSVRVFSDAAGVVRAVSSSGERAVIITPNVAQFVNLANTTPEQTLVQYEVKDFEITRVLTTNANLRSGAITQNGVVINVYGVEDLGGEAGAIYAEVPNTANFVYSVGSSYGSAPTGTFSYEGTLATGIRSVSDPQLELGSFILVANFDQRTYGISGSTLSDTIDGTGVLNTSTGTFQTDNLRMVTSSTSRTATMYGQFHGVSAQSVSGVFHTNENDPVFAGAFVGSR